MLHLNLLESVSGLGIDTENFVFLNQFTARSIAFLPKVDRERYLVRECLWSLLNFVQKTGMWPATLGIRFFLGSNLLFLALKRRPTYT